MAMFPEYRILTEEQIAEVSLRIEREYEAINVEFIEQSNHYCKYSGSVGGESLIFSYDKLENVIVYESQS